MTNPENMIPIDAILGNETGHDASASFYMFWLPRKSDAQPKAEIGIDSASKYCHDIQKKFGSVTPAFSDRDMQKGGTWSENRYLIADGMTLKLWGDKTAWGVSAGRAAVILLCSKDAPVNRVIMKLTPAATANKHEVHVTGQFFVLNRDTVGEHPEVPTLMNTCAHFAAPVFINELFTIKECIPAPQKAMAIKKNTVTVNTGDRIITGGTHTDGTIILRTTKGKRVLG